MTTSNEGGINLVQVMDCRFNQIAQMMTWQYRNLNTMVYSNFIQLNAIVSKINADIDDLKRTSEMNRVDIDRAAADITTLNEERELVSQRLDKLEQLVDHNEVDLKSCNLRFQGIPEGGTTSFPTIDVIVDILNQYSYHGSWDHRDLDRAYRVGERRGDQDNPRPIVVHMHRWADKMDILRDQQMRDALRRDNIRVASELTTRQRGMVDFHTKQGKKAYYWKGKLQVEDKPPNFSNPRMQGYGPGHTSTYDHRRDEQYYQGSMLRARDVHKQHDRNWKAGFNESQVRRNDYPRVAPGHSTYSQVVKEGRQEPSCPVDDFRSSRQLGYSNGRPSDSRRTQYPRQLDRSRDEQRIVFMKGRTRIPLSTRKHNDEPVKGHNTVEENYKDKTQTSTRSRSTGADKPDNKERSGGQEDTQEQDGQLSDYEKDTESPTGYSEQTNKEGPQLGTTSTCVPEDQQHLTPQVEEVDIPPTNKTQGLEKEKEARAKADRPAADVSAENGADRTSSQQSVLPETEDIQDDAGTENIKGGQSEGRRKCDDRRGVTDKVSPSVNKEVQERRARMTTRSGSTKGRSLSQSSIKDAFRKDSGNRSGSRDTPSGKNREGQVISPKPGGNSCK